jgi:hypothetical protein
MGEAKGIITRRELDKIYKKRISFIENKLQESARKYEGYSKESSKSAMLIDTYYGLTY